MIRWTVPRSETPSTDFDEGGGLIIGLRGDDNHRIEGGFNHRIEGAFNHRIEGGF
jgi:hypothetical protein